MTQWYGAVLGVLVASGLLLLVVEVCSRTGRRSRRRTRRSRPMFQRQRNGRVRFELEDLRRSAAATTNRRLPRPEPGHPVPDLENTIPDLFDHRVVPRQRPHQPGR